MSIREKAEDWGSIIACALMLMLVVVHGIREYQLTKMAQEVQEQITYNELLLEFLQEEIADFIIADAVQSQTGVR